jgi:excisionase family DNA binding protein
VHASEKWSVVDQSTPTKYPTVKTARRARRDVESSVRQDTRTGKERYLSVPEVAELLGTSERFPRRLIEERRIEFKRFGRHVRIAESVLSAYIESCTVEPILRVRSGRRAA